MAKRKTKTKRKATARKGGKSRAGEDEPVSLRPMEFSDAIAVLLRDPSMGGNKRQ